MTATPPYAPAPGRSLRLMIADDNAADVALLAEVLAMQEAPVAVQSAADGAAALELLRHAGNGGDSLPDLVLLDLNMPRLDGLEALAAIKADPALRHLPVIVLTTSDLPADVRRAAALGATAYFTKPRALPDAMVLARALLDFCTRATPLPSLHEYIETSLTTE